MTKYGDKRDYPKIDIFVNQQYVASTSWSKTCREAVEHYREAHPELANAKITACFDRR